jgi:hypothetical protein
MINTRVTFVQSRTIITDIAIDENAFYEWSGGDEPTPELVKEFIECDPAFPTDPIIDAVEYNGEVQDAWLDVESVRLV